MHIMYGEVNDWICIQYVFFYLQSFFYVPEETIDLKSTL